MGRKKGKKGNNSNKNASNKASTKDSSNKDDDAANPTEPVEEVVEADSAVESTDTAAAGEVTSGGDGGDGGGEGAERAEGGEGEEGEEGEAGEEGEEGEAGEDATVEVEGEGGEGEDGGGEPQEQQEQQEQQVEGEGADAIEASVEGAEGGEGEGTKAEQQEEEQEQQHGVGAEGESGNANEAQVTETETDTEAETQAEGEPQGETQAEIQTEIQTAGETEAGESERTPEGNPEDAPPADSAGDGSGSGSGSSGGGGADEADEGGEPVEEAESETPGDATGDDSNNSNNDNDNPTSTTSTTADTNHNNTPPTEGGDTSTGGEEDQRVEPDGDSGPVESEPAKTTVEGVHDSSATTPGDGGDGDGDVGVAEDELNESGLDETEGVSETEPSELETSEGGGGGGGGSPAGRPGSNFLDSPASRPTLLYESDSSSAPNTPEVQRRPLPGANGKAPTAATTTATTAAAGTTSGAQSDDSTKAAGSQQQQQQAPQTAAAAGSTAATSRALPATPAGQPGTGGVSSSSGGGGGAGPASSRPPLPQAPPSARRGGPKHTVFDVPLVEIPPECEFSLFVRKHLGDPGRALRASRLPEHAVPPTLEGLKILMASGNWHAAALAAREVVKATQLPHEGFQALLARTASLMKLRLYGAALREVEAVGNLPPEAFRYEGHPDVYTRGETGMLVPFSLRVLHAQLHRYTGKPDETTARLFSLVAVCRAEVAAAVAAGATEGAAVSSTTNTATSSSSSSGGGGGGGGTESLAEPASLGGGSEGGSGSGSGKAAAAGSEGGQGDAFAGLSFAVVVPTDPQERYNLWNQRLVRVLTDVINHLVALDRNVLALSVYERELLPLCQSDINTLAGYGRLLLKMGNNKAAATVFTQIEDLSDGSSEHVAITKLNSGYLAVSNSEYHGGHRLFTEALQAAAEVKSTNATALALAAANNASLCSLYAGELNAAIALLEGLVAERPAAVTNPTLVQNLCLLYGLSGANAAERKRELLAAVAASGGDDVDPRIFRL